MDGVVNIGAKSRGLDTWKHSMSMSMSELQELQEGEVADPYLPEARTFLL